MVLSLFPNVGIQASLVTPGEMRVGRADNLAIVLLREEAQHTGPGFATLGEIGLL